MSSLISIIIPTYNNDKFILRAIQSALNQTYSKIEVIVVNDGSTDETESIISDLILNKDIKYYFQDNKGASSARNLGIKKASGEYLLFLDADDILTVNGISELLKCILETNADMSVGLAEKELTVESRFIYGNNHLANLIANWWPISTVMIKKNSTRWNEEMKVWEVIDYFSKLLLNDFRCTICSKVVTCINHTPRNDRVTYLHAHYDSFKSFEFFSDLKNHIVSENKLDQEVAESIDKHLLSYAYSMYKESKKLISLEKIAIKNLKNYRWFKTIGLSGFCSILGFQKGMFVFYTLNRFLRRA